MDWCRIVLCLHAGLVRLYPQQFRAEFGHEVDVERARRARERAERRLAEAKTAEIDWVRAEASLRRAMVRMKVAGR